MAAQHFLPGLGQYGPTSPYGSPLDRCPWTRWHGPTRLETLKTAQTQRDVLRTLLPEVIEAAC